MLMGVAHPVVASRFALFYVWNLVVALLVLVFGGLYAVSRFQRGAFQLFPPDHSLGRRILTVGLGSLWILDGLLQAQPLIVTQFAALVLDPLKAGQPRLVADLVRLGIHLWRLHPLIWDSGAVWLQIFIGLGIILGRETHGRRWALAAAVAWGLIVWGPGEAFGTILSRGSWLVGSPGSAFLYVLAAAALLLPTSWWTSARFIRLWELAIAALWSLAAILQAWPTNFWWSPKSLSRFFLVQARMPQPSAVSEPIYGLAHIIIHAGHFGNAIFVGVFAALAVFWGIGHPNRAIWGLTALVTALTWWLGQDLGIFGGMATDPNSGILLLLVLIVYLTLRLSHPDPRSPDLITRESLPDVDPT